MFLFSFNHRKNIKNMRCSEVFSDNGAECGVAFPLQTSVAAFSLFSEMQEADVFTNNFLTK